MVIKQIIYMPQQARHWQWPDWDIKKKKAVKEKEKAKPKATSKGCNDAFGSVAKIRPHSLRQMGKIYTGKSVLVHSVTARTKLSQIFAKDKTCIQHGTSIFNTSQLEAFIRSLGFVLFARVK